MSRQLLLLFLVALPLLQGCGDRPSMITSERHPAVAMTWAEWVAREAPKRPTDYVSYYHKGRGVPDMSAWRPEDFLPEEYLETEHADICSLPREDRGKVVALLAPDYHKYDPRRIANNLDYARQGFAEAQANMGLYCLSSTLALATRWHVEGDPGHRADGRRGLRMGAPRRRER